MKLKNSWKRFWTLDHHHAAGFTLVELIVVIAILAILAGVAIPVYSGYIKKAELAADEQLLAAVNTAFAAACLQNGASHINPPKTPEITLIDGTDGKKVDSVSLYNEDFGLFFAGNENSEFKVFTDLYYVIAKGAFVPDEPITLSIYGTSLTISSKDMALLSASNLGAFGAETLLTELDGVADWAKDNGLASLAGEPFNNAFKSYLGLDSDATDEEFAAAIVGLGGDPDKVTANAIALYAAQSSENLTIDSLKAWIGGSTDNMQSNANANTLSEAAAIYGLYMSYKGDDFDSDAGALSIMTNALSDQEGFGEWLNTKEGEQELEAYLAAMNTISTVTDNQKAASEVLVKGFNDSELVELMKQLMGK